MSWADEMFASAAAIGKEMAEAAIREKEQKRIRRNDLARKRYRYRPKEVSKVSKSEMLQKKHDEEMMIAEYASEHCICHLGNPPCTYCMNKNED